MYSEKIIHANLDNFAYKEGWTPRYHTIEEVQEFTAYIDSIVSQDTRGINTYFNLKKELSTARAKEIRRWVENEQVLCMFDSGYYESRYAWACDEKGEIFKFTNRKSQEVFDNIVADFDEKQIAIELFILKARQLGMTTKTALKFLHRMLFIPHTQAVMGSVNEGKSELITRIIETCISRTPFWLLPERTTSRIKLIGFKNGSLLSVQSGNQATGIAQGWTPTCVHLSEIGDIPNPKKTIEEGLLRAVHSTRKLFLVLEGTGNGSTGWQADKWRAAKADYPLGRSQFFPMFVNWPMAPDLYPELDWLRKHPIPGNFKPLEVTRKHVQRCELFIRNTPYLARVVGKNWQMSIQQKWFWEFKYLEAAQTHTQKVWMAQMPADDFEALIGLNDRVFDSIVIDTVTQERKKGYQAYAITGDSIDDGFEPDESEIDYEKDRLRVTWNSHRGQRFEWVMVPLLPFDETDERSSLDKILIFEDPNSAPGREGREEDYSIGIDTADGLGHDDEDRSVCSVTRSMQGENCDVQVAEFCSNRVNAPQMVGFAACLAAFYGQKTSDPRGCKFAIEQRERPGDDCQLQLKLMGFTFHHIDTRYDSKVVRENKGHREGWYTNAWSRPLLLNRFIDAVENGWYRPNSPFLITELGSLERKVSKTGKSRMEHQSGRHDDRVLAAAMSYFTYHALDVMAQRSQIRYAPPTQKNPDLDLSFPTSSQMSVGEWA